MRIGLLAVFGVLSLCGAASAETPSDADTYQACMTMARQAPGKGFELGSQWQGHGGGEPAEHCIAIALIGLKQYVEAGQRLEVLATGMIRDSPELRAETLSQAAEAWSEGGQPARAEADLNEAIRLAPNQLDYRVDRATARAEQRHYPGAIDDLTSVIAAGSTRGDVYAYRAAAYRLSGDLKAAAADADHAVRNDPQLPEAWLERANTRRLSGDTNGARQDWLMVVKLAPDSDAGDAARRNLEALDVNSAPQPPAP